MAKIPSYGGTQVEATNLPNVQLSDSGVTAATFGANDGLASIGRVGAQIALAEQEKNNRAALMDFENQVVRAKTGFIHDPEKGVLTRRGANAIGMSKDLFPEWERSGSGLVSSVPKHLQAQAQELLGKHTESVRTVMMRHELQEADEHHKAQATAGIELAYNDASLNRYDPAAVDQAVDRAMLYASERLTAQGVTGDARELALRQTASGGYRAALLPMIEDDPVQAQEFLDQWRPFLTADDEAAVNSRLAPLRDARRADAIGDAILQGMSPQAVVEPSGPSTFDAAVQDVFRVEGGFVANDADKGPSNFGINATANPDVDVPNLTKAQARKLYRERYWDAIGADELPESIRGIAFDAAVNQGPEQAKEWAAASGGDLAKFQQLRREHYASLVKSNPGKFKKYEAGWMARVDKFGRPAVATGEAVDPPETEAEALRRVDAALADNPILRADVRRRVSAEFALRDLEAKQVESAKKDAELAAHQAIYEKVVNAPASAPLSSILSREEQVAVGANAALNESINRFRKIAASGRLVEDDPVLVDALKRLQAFGPDEFKTFDLAAHGDRLSGATLLSFRKAQQEDDPAARARWASDEALMRQQFRRMGWETEGKVNATERGQFKIAWDYLRGEFIQQHNRPPSSDEAAKLMRDLELRTITKDKRPLYEGLSGTLDTEQVPPEDHARIRDLLIQTGEKPTELAIRKLWLERQAEEESRG